LIELELDFSEEDVEFADRTQFKELLTRIQKVLQSLIDSFAVGNVIKNGIPVAIVGEPNVGKSTLLNAFLNEERALVSDIAGTTRDTIEDEISIGGIGFRFIDTAGIRETQDVVEGMGIKRTFEKIEQAQVVLLLVDGSKLLSDDKKLKNIIIDFEKIKNQNPQKPLVLLVNKADTLSKDDKNKIGSYLDNVKYLSAKTGEGVEELQNNLLEFVNTGALRNNETIVTNTRHYNSLLKALEEIEKVQFGMKAELSSDLMAIDVREALYHLGEITGQVTNDELLGNIFANFCIGK
jgi:tRNA modification GTPase